MRCSFVEPEPPPSPAFVVVVSCLLQFSLLPELPGHGPVPAVGPDEQVVVVTFLASTLVANGATATTITTMAAMALTANVVLYDFVILYHNRS